MSKEKGGCGDMEKGSETVCSASSVNDGIDNQEQTANSQEFIDIHPTEAIASPVEECGEDLRSGGSTIAEITEKFSQQCVESGDEYHSAEEDDKDMDIPGDKFYSCVSEGVGGNNCVGQSMNGVTEETIRSRTDPDRGCTDSVASSGAEADRLIPGAEGEANNNGEGESEDSDLEDEKVDKKPKEIEEDEEHRKAIEESLSDDEKVERKDQAQQIKDKGNQSFREGSYKEAIKQYNEALQICPLSFPKERSIMYSNRAACQMKLEDTDDAIKSCSKALELHPHYMKALLRRAELHEKADKLDEALTDYQKAVELDPSQHAARHAALRLADQVKERNEKLKEEMLGKLKDLGNMILKPFGMSTENFQLQQDPQSGSYSVNFQQNAQK